MVSPLRIFIGWDDSESIAYHVLSHSILKRASGPVSIQPVMKSQLKGIYTRERGPTESTDFSLTRFLVPYLCNYEGWAIFCDCDMLCLTDIYQVFEATYIYPTFPLYACKHDYVPKGDIKFDGHTQTKYKMKNWSSFMLFNNSACKALTPEYVNTASGLELHQFEWLRQKGDGWQSSPESRIRGLDLSWNHLVGEYDKNPDAKILHFTGGGPWHEGYRDCDNSFDWLVELGSMTKPISG